MVMMNGSSSDLGTSYSGSSAFVTRRKGSHVGLAPRSPPQRSEVFFFLEDSVNEEPHHFLDACALCTKPFHPNHDIYMYRGNTPFCSEECRQEQIEMDEAMEKSRKLSSCSKITKMKSSVVKTPESQSIHVRTGTVVAV